MSLILQSTAAFSHLDGLSTQSQSKDSETIQSISFGDVLKVEEKKLQQEQETNALSVAAMLMTIPPPVITETISKPDVSGDNATVKVNAQTAPTTASVNSASATPQQNALPNNNPSTTQKTVPTSKAPFPAGTTVTGGYPSEFQITGVETKDQTALSVTFATISTRNNGLVSSVATPVFNTETTSEKTNEKVSARVNETSPISKALSSKVEIAATQSVGIKTTGESITFEKQQAQIKQPGTEIVDKFTVSTDAKIASDTPRVDERPEKVTISAASPVEVSSLANKANISTEKVAAKDNVGNSENIPAVNKSEVNANQKTFITETKSVAPLQTKTTAVEDPHPVENENIPVANLVVSDAAGQSKSASNTGDKEVEIRQKTSTTEMKPVGALEPSAPANENVLTPAVEVSQTFETTKTQASKTVLSDAAGQLKNSPAAITSESGLDKTTSDIEPRTAASMEMSTPVVESLLSESRVKIPVTRTISADAPAQNVPVSVVVDSKVRTDQKPFSENTKPLDPAQTSISNGENPQSVSKVNIPVTEKNTPVTESSNREPVAPAAVQKEGLNISPAPSSTHIETTTSNVNPEADMQDASTLQPITGAAGLVDEMQDTALKNKDYQAPVALGHDNATDESRMGTANKPKVGNEPFAFVQENIPASIRTEAAAKSAQTEIKTEEKILPQETKRESDLDLESKVVVPGTDVGTVNVKTAEKSTVAQIEPAFKDVIDQITSQMNARIKSGETSIRMQLNPKELGAIEVQMTHSAQGVSVSFITEQAGTGQLLESQANQLRQLLKDAGVQLTNLNVSQHNQSNQQGGSFKQGQQFVQNPRRDAPQAEAIIQERMRPQRIGGLTSEIDYLI